MTIPFIWHPSPNFNERPDNTLIDTIVLHYTDMETCQESLARLCDPNYKVSCHYLVNDNGDIYQLVKDEHRAWHAGISHWQGRDNVNDFSIGIELQNFGYQYFIAKNEWQPYTTQQIDNLLILLDFLTSQHNIAPCNIIGHSDVAPGRKIDPGPHFPWDLVHQHFEKL